MLGVVHRRTLPLALCLCASMAVLAPASAPAVGLGEAFAGCPGARANVAKASARKLRLALLCLVNRKRVAEGLKALKLDRGLQRAAGRHARDMVRHGYFAHRRAGGPDLGERLGRAGWHGSACGETIAYGCGSSGSPAATLRGWLDSPPHRAILLSGSYRRGGLGVGFGALCGRRGATWVLDVGSG